MKHNLPVAGRKIRIGIVGFGRISKNHLGSIEKHANELELVPVHYVKDSVLASQESQYGGPSYQDMSANAQ